MKNKDDFPAPILGCAILIDEVSPFPNPLSFLSPLLSCLFIPTFSAALLLYAS